MRWIPAMMIVLFLSTTEAKAQCRLFNCRPQQMMAVPAYQTQLTYVVPTYAAVMPTYIVPVQAPAPVPYQAPAPMPEPTVKPASIRIYLPPHVELKLY